MSLIEINGLGKSFGNFKAVDNVSISVDEGEIFGLLGPNGAGKSTLISMITTLVPPDDGEIVINGFDIRKQKSQIKKILGLVPQDIALYPTLSAKENLDFWGRMYGIGGKLLTERVNDALEIAGLKDRAKDRIEKYSGGMKRRINIAAALIHRPEILIMDEPTVGIDPQSRNHILETVLKLNKEGMTVIYTSHYMEEVEFLCSRVAIMDNGKVIAKGSKDELRKTIGDLDTIDIEIAQPDEALIGKLKAIPGIDNIIVEEKILKIMAKEAGTVLAAIVSKLDNEKRKIHSINLEEANLESVFLHLTGRALRD